LSHPRIGSVVCQIAKIKGHTVTGPAGGADKGSFLKQIGVDHVIDYKATGNLTEACYRRPPTGSMCTSTTSRASTWRGALTAANRFARFALRGMISQYNVAGMPAHLDARRLVDFPQADRTTCTPCFPVGTGGNHRNDGTITQPPAKSLRASSSN
jgi:NADPH-dependent curcumin reductase CurA